MGALEQLQSLLVARLPLLLSAEQQALPVVDRVQSWALQAMAGESLSMAGLRTGSVRHDGEGERLLPRRQPTSFGAMPHLCELLLGNHLPKTQYSRQVLWRRRQLRNAAGDTTRDHVWESCLAVVCNVSVPPPLQRERATPCSVCGEERAHNIAPRAPCGIASNAYRAGDTRLVDAPTQHLRRARTQAGWQVRLALTL